MISFDIFLKESRARDNKDIEEVVWIDEKGNWDCFLWLVEIFSAKWWKSNGDLTGGVFESALWGLREKVKKNDKSIFMYNHIGPSNVGERMTSQETVMREPTPEVPPDWGLEWCM